MSGCKGRGPELRVEALPGTSGQICLTGPLSYRVEEAGEDRRDVEFEEDPLLNLYQGNIGGQIRAVAKMNMASSSEEANEVLVWGSGASIRYGQPGEEATTVLLRRRGAVTGLAPIRVDDKPHIVYGTERGLGLVGPDSSGLMDMVGAYRPVPAGVWSVAGDEDGDRIAFATGDGYLQVTSASDLSAGKECASILSSSKVLRVEEQRYLPVDVELTRRHAFVLATLGSMVTSTAPTFEQVYDPIFAGMVADVPIAIVRGVNLENGEVYEISFDAADGSFDFYDRFIPTDIATDGQDLYVVGISYKQGSVESFLASNCVGSIDEQVACMREAARSGSLTHFHIDYIYSFNAGFFVYRGASDLSKADHFTSIPLTTFRHDEKAPPFIYRMAVEGDRGFVRGPNFMVAMSRQTSYSGQEEWRFVSEVDKNAGLMAGIPNDLVGYAGGAAASFTAVRAADGTGASALELMSAEGQFRELDTGAILVRVEGGGGVQDLVAAVDMVSAGGGNLYLENFAQRRAIGDLGFANAYVSHADYDGSMLAFIWSSTGIGGEPDPSQVWRLMVQSGSDAGTRGEPCYIKREGDDWHFKDFPALGQEQPPDLLRGVGDLALAPDNKVAVLYTGYSGEKWYYQVGLYHYSSSAGQHSPYLVGISKTKIIAGSLSGHRGRILKVDKVAAYYKIVFSAADGVYSWTVIPGDRDRPEEGTVSGMFSVIGLVDASVDALGTSYIALVHGNNIVIKDLANPNLGFRDQVPTPGDYTKLIGARVALAGKVLVLATPYGATAPFFLYKIQDGSISLLAPCSTCRFLDVNVFKSFQAYLLASSMSSGIEIYSIEGL